MSNPLVFQEVEYFSKLRRLNSFKGDAGVKADCNKIQFDVLKKEDERKGEKSRGEKRKQQIESFEKGDKETIVDRKRKQQEDDSSDNEEESNITCNLIKKITIYGINLNVNIFILENSNIIFFAQNLINVYNPIIEKLRTVYTKDECLITSAALAKQNMVIALYGGLSKRSCIQLYNVEDQSLQEEIIMQDLDYYEKIYVYKQKNYYILVTNKQVLKVLDVEQKKFIFTISVHTQCNDISQYFDMFIVFRNKKLYMWTLEETYTGMKIQESEMISDDTFYVSCFCIYERNIFVANSKGNVFLWKDFYTNRKINNGTTNDQFHKTPITFLHFYENLLLTKGKEEIRIWKCFFSSREGGRSDDSDWVFSELKKEIKIGCNDLHINKIISHEKFSLIVDTINWNLFWLNNETNETVEGGIKGIGKIERIERIGGGREGGKEGEIDNYSSINLIYNDHNKRIKYIYYKNNNIFSFGYNGIIYNYFQKDNKERNIGLYQFKEPITSSRYLYEENGFLYFVLGFINGLIKIIKMKSLYLDVIYCVKVSNQKIIKIEKNETADLIAIISYNESDVFFLSTETNIKQYKPLGYLNIKENEIKDCFYLSGLKAFYLLTKNNLLFKIKSIDLLKQKNKIQKQHNLEKEKDEKKKDEKDKVKTEEQTEKQTEVETYSTDKVQKKDQHSYDINTSYQIIQIIFDNPQEETPSNISIETFKKKKKKKKKNLQLKTLTI